MESLNLKELRVSSNTVLLSQRKDCTGTQVGSAEHSLFKDADPRNKGASALKLYLPWATIPQPGTETA